MLKALRPPTTLFNSHLLASRTASSSLTLGIGARAARSYATETTLPSTSSANSVTSVGKGKKDEVPEGPLRPQLGVEVDPNHGLWAFFRKKVGKNGVETYETIEPGDNTVDYSGRAWSAAELRRKSFKDLHTLWYVVLRERNLLETQLLEVKRLGALQTLSPSRQRAFRCRKTMARIKYVINERRLAYEGAVQIIAGDNEHEVLAKRERAARRKAVLGDEAKELEKQETAASAVKEPPAVVHQTAAQRAAAGLIQQT